MFLEKIRQWWHHYCMTNEERYLSEAVDVVDFECRLKRVETQRHQKIHMPI
jgi:hypothetical protein